MPNTEILPARAAPRIAFPLALARRLQAVLPKKADRQPRRTIALDERLLAELGLRPVPAPGDSRQYAARKSRPAEFDYAYYAALQRR